jgi:hypothetical protein
MDLCCIYIFNIQFFFFLIELCCYYKKKLRGVAITTFIITEYDMIDELLFIKNMRSMKYEICQTTRFF